MAGNKPGPAKGTVRLTNMHREKIAKSQILQRLIGHAEGSLPADQEMSQSQVTAAIALLKKVLPDMTEHNHKGDPENPLQINLVQRAIVRPANPDG